MRRAFGERYIQYSKGVLLPWGGWRRLAGLGLAVVGRSYPGHVGARSQRSPRVPAASMSAGRGERLARASGALHARLQPLDERPAELTSASPNTTVHRYDGRRWPS